MNIEQRRTLFLGGLIVLTIVTMVFFFFWRNYISKGTLVLIGEAPFNVQVFDTEEFYCSTSPCTTRLKTGTYNVSIIREEAEPIFETVTIRLWAETEMKLKFKNKPAIQKIDIEIPRSKITEYLIAPDNENRMYKLILADDQEQRPLVFFPSQINPLKIIGSQNHVLIFEDSDPLTIYKIDLSQKTREKQILNITGSLPDIKQGYLSQNGKYLVFWNDQNPFFQIFNGKEILETNLLKTNSRISWISDDQLAFVSLQPAISSVGSGKYQNYITLETESDINNENNSAQYTFGFYHPDENSYSKIETFYSLKSLPEFIIGSADKNSLYFKVEDEFFKLTF